MTQILSPRKNLRALLVLAALMLLASVFAQPAPAQASKGGSCATFVATLSDGTAYSGNQDRVIRAARVHGKTLSVKGRYVEFTIDLNTFRVTNYLLTGAAHERDITGGQRTLIFASKEPLHGVTMTGDLTLRINSEQLVLIRNGGIKMKIQAKDCAQGGLFQMETSRTITYGHQLAPGFRYYTDALGRTLFTNGTVVGRESPQSATLVARDDAAGSSRWRVQATGRMGGVLGEDAIEP